MKRYLTFAYGALSYVIFLAAFLYSIGFVGNLSFPEASIRVSRRLSGRRLLSLYCCSGCLPCSAA
jgi:hypothetical protein